jgi:hypothetical protein
VAAALEAGGIGVTGSADDGETVAAADGDGEG